MSRTDSTRSTNSTTVSCWTSPMPESGASECSVRMACSSSSTGSPMLNRLRASECSISDDLQPRFMAAGEEGLDFVDAGHAWE